MDYKEVNNNAILAKSDAADSSSGSTVSAKTDVGAIADAIGAIANLVKENINLTAKNYYSRLLGANNSYKNIFGQYKQGESVFPIVIIGVCVLGVMAIVIVKLVQNKN